MSEPLDRRVRTSSGVDLRVLDWLPAPGAADGTPFLAVHGLASNAHLWDGVARRLAALGHRVVAVDQRGHGASDKPGDGFDDATLTGDLVDVATALDLGPVVAMGQSWGGNVVLALARRHPDATRAVVAVDGGTIDLRDRFPDADTAWAALAPPDLTALRLDDLTARWGTAMDDWPAEGVLGQLANLAVTTEGTVVPNLSRTDHETIVRAMWDDAPARWYEQVDRPVLLLPVVRDDGGGFAEGVDAALARLPDGRVHRFRDRHHDVHAQAPDEVVAAIRAGLPDVLVRDADG